ncbi:MAG: hypothetical protein OXB88_01945 [Bacteriovoracales bacterium]|nr:hypothetical protein [Bacteriovoracales bacterium]
MKPFFAIFFLLLFSPSLWAREHCLKKLGELNARVEKKWAMADSSEGVKKWVRGRGAKKATKKRNHHRVKLSRKLFHAGKEKEYMELLWDSHDNFDVADWEKLRGRSLKREKRIQSLMVDNANKYMPSYFQFNDKRDTFAAIMAIVRDIQGSSGRSALKEIEEWMSFVRNYQSDLEKTVKKAFLAREDVMAMNPHVDKGLLQITWMKIFPEGWVDWFVLGKSYARGRGRERFAFEKFKRYPRPSIEVSRSDGSVDRINLPSMSFMGSEFNKRRDIVHHTFTRNFIDEWRKKSLVYERMTEQAFMFQRFEYLYEALLSIPKGTRTVDHHNLIERIATLLSTPGHQPRSDVVAKAQKKVMWAEFFNPFKGKKSKENIIKGYKFELPDGVAEVISNSPLGKHIKYYVGGGALSASAGTLAYLLFAPIVDSPWVRAPFSFPKFWFNYLGLILLGDKRIRECAKKWSGTSSCFKGVLNRYSGWFKNRERMSRDLHDWGVRDFFHRLGLVDDPDRLYRMEDDELYDRVSLRLGKILAKLRHEFRASSFDKAYTESYMRAMIADHDEFMKGFILHLYEDKVDDLEKRYDELVEAAQAEDEEKVSAILSRIETQSEEVGQELKIYFLDKRAPMIDFMKKMGIRPDGDSLEEIYKEMGLD